MHQLPMLIFMLLAEQKTQKREIIIVIKQNIIEISKVIINEQT